jgi:chitinase
MFYAVKSGMNALSKLRLTLTAAVALSFAHPVKANLITNGDFETGNLNGWTYMPGPDGTVTVVDHGPGPDTTFGAKFESDQFITNFATISQTFATTPGAFYTLTFFYQVVGGVPGTNEFFVDFGINNLVFHDLNANPHFGTVTLNVEAPSTLTELSFGGFNPQLFDFLDDVSVTAVPDAGSTLPLLGFASLGLAALRRKLSC